MRFYAAVGLFFAAVLPVGAAPRLVPRPGHLPRAAARRSAALPAAADPAAAALLIQMLQAENTLALSGDQTTIVARKGLDISSEQQVQRNGAHALRLDYLRPARLAGERIIDTGRFYCHLIPSQDTLEISPSRVSTLRVRVPQVIRQIKTGRLSVQQAGTDTVAGHACIILQVIAQSRPATPSQKFWIDPVNGAQLRNEQYDSAGRLRSASYFTQVSYSPVFAKDAFRLPRSGKIVSGAAPPTLTLDQVRAQAGFAVQVPTVLPSGFHYQGGSVSSRGNSAVVELRFSSGASGLSVFETPEKTGRSALPLIHPRPGVLFARRNGLKIVVIASLGNAELDNLLASLR